jgi:hypothetical protein
LEKALSLGVYYQICAGRRWRGPGCRALQVLEAVVRHPGEEVPLVAERLGLGPAHAPILALLQRELGPSAYKHNAVAKLLPLVNKAFKIQVLREIRRALGL